MMRIRLSRFGRKKRPFYRIIAVNSCRPRQTIAKEVLGTYDPLLPKDNEKRVILKKERIEYWIGVGAQPSERVLKLMKHYS